MASVSTVSGIAATAASSYTTAAATTTASSSSDTSSELEQLKAEKNKDQQQLTELQKDAKNANSVEVKNLKKQIETLEKEIQQLESESSDSTAAASSSSGTASTAKTMSAAQQDKELLQKIGPAYETKISNAGYAAQKADDEQKQTQSNQLS